MPRIGQRAGRLIAACRWPALGALAAIVPALWMWGFTVDDALISIRYAQHVASGAGWRMNAGGPSTDGVTPLPWPLLLAPLAHTDALVVLGRAKALGLVTWACAGAAMGARVGTRVAASTWARVAALAAMALSVPIAAHAVSGMETAIATSLATIAALCVQRPMTAAALAGLAASLRPEMAAWAGVLATGLVVAERGRVVRAVAVGAVALAPFVLCAIVRTIAWGRPAPLALMAKPSDLEHGLAYAGAATVVVLTPVLVLAPIALRRSPHATAIVAAGIAHLLAVAAAGGDWMPFARLLVPVAPSLAWAGVLVAEHARPAATAARSIAAIVLGVTLVVFPGTVAEGRRVGGDRAALVASARPLLSRAKRVASLDVGWVGAATAGDVVDLAGVTDAEIAALPGGHTSKRVDSMLLLSRDPDAVLLWLPWGVPGADIHRWREALYARQLEATLARDEVVARHFAAAAWLPLGPRGGYVLLRKIE